MLITKIDAQKYAEMASILELNIPAILVIEMVSKEAVVQKIVKFNKATLVKF